MLFQSVQLLDVQLLFYPAHIRPENQLIVLVDQTV